MSVSVIGGQLCISTCDKAYKRYLVIPSMYAAAQPKVSSQLREPVKPI